MNYKRLTIRIINTILAAATLGVIGYSVHLFAVAQDVAAPAAVPGVGTSTPITVCEQDMSPFIDEKQAEFTQFINTHFQSPKETSELIPIAIERYSQYKKDLENEAARFKAPEETSQACQDMIGENLNAVKMLLREHIMANAYAKKTTRLLDKYKEINGKLEKLNFTIAQTYGYFAAMSQRLPCYVKECKTK